MAIFDKISGQYFKREYTGVICCQTGFEYHSSNERMCKITKPINEYHVPFLKISNREMTFDLIII